MGTNTLPTRAQVPVELTWDLTTIYANVAAWETDFAKVEGLIARLAEHQGKLATSADSLLAMLKDRDQVLMVLDNLWNYAHLRADEDTTVSANKALRERARQLFTNFGAAYSYAEPEILAMDESVLTGFLSASNELAKYSFELENLMRKKPHIRSQEVEELLAQASLLHAGPSNVYDMLGDADMEFPKLVDGNGERVRLTHGNYAEVFLMSPKKPVRLRAYKAMFGTYGKYRNTLSATYAARVQSEIFEAKARGHASTRAHRLFETNVPLSVYDSLISTVHANIPRMTRYLEMRKRKLGLKKLNFCDLYVPLVGDVDYKPTYAEAKETVLQAVAPLGAEYVAALRNGFDSRWVDVVENQNKASGAYSSGGYQTAPYMLLNWQDSLESMFTLAHEAGHSMHSWHSRKHQPFHDSGYTIFVAEVASTLNEALLAHHLLQTSNDDSMRAHIINHQLENIRQTLYRQTLFAEFEMIAHQRAEAGEVLTPDVLCEIHRDLNQKYYGAAVEMDDLIPVEWMRIPHFYNSFYVYQYATGISAAMALTRQILSEGEPAVKRYLKFLSSGGSKYSIDLLRDAGVDLSSPKPVEQALDAFEDYLVEFEKLG
ncbi:oligoendopeptidase F [Candidatus Obscuribacterales bacterium]|nr:oligoendopeptidase F [Candidatus Obscuribacterales bacterium]MBX3152777.1 oligoendopeptidase F [Candidatus Obscuribacterales bacterium]